MDIGAFILSFVLQMVFTLGFVFLFGKVIALCNGAFYRNFGSKGRAVCYATGFIGTPVHEASHALMCLIFGHKIVEIKFFQPNSSDGTLGYVRHSYNPKNIYQKVGCLFIGIAPVLVGALILAGLLYLLLPELFGAVSSEIAAVDFAEDIGASFGHIWRSFFFSACACFSMEVATLLTQPTVGMIQISLRTPALPSALLYPWK